MLFAIYKPHLFFYLGTINGVDERREKIPLREW